MTRKRPGIETIKAANEVARYMNVPVWNKRVAFIFGAGINFNIAEKSQSWHDLALNSFKTFVKKNRKNLTKLEIDAVAGELVNRISNSKLALSFNDEVSISEIRAKSEAENRWFRDSFDKMDDRLSGIEVLTLNYDRVLEKVIERHAVNYLNEDAKDKNNEILHLHGLVNEHGKLDGRSLLNLRDYVELGSKAEKKLSEFLTSKAAGNQSSDIHETVVIIGSSMQEEHILRALKEHKDKSRFESTNIFLILHVPRERYFVKRLEEIYLGLNINVLNINSGKSINDDFRDFWELLSDLVQGNRSMRITDFEERTDVIDNSLYFLIKEATSKLKLRNTTIDELVKNNVISEKMLTKNYVALMRPLYWLKNDGVISEDEFKKFFMKYCSSQLEWIHLLKFSELEDSDVDKIMGEFEKAEEESISRLTYRLGNHELDSFVKINFERIDFNKYPKILSKYLKRVVFDHWEKVDTDVASHLVSNYSIKADNDSEIFDVYIDTFPTSESNAVKILEKSIAENGSVLGAKIPTKNEEIYKFIKQTGLERSTLLYVFSVKRVRDIIYENLDLAISAFTLAREKEKSEDGNYYIYRYYVLLCFVFLNSEKESEFIEKIKKAASDFKKFPEAIDYLGHSSNDTPKYSKWDGELFEENIFEFKSIDEIKKIGRHDWSEKRAAALVSFVKNNFNMQLIEELYEMKDLKDLAWGIDVKPYVHKCETWSEFLEYIEKMPETTHWGRDFGFITIQPPHDVIARVDEIVDSLENSKDTESLFKELNEIIIIKMKLGYYGSSSVMWNKEIKVSLKYFNTNNFARESVYTFFQNKFKISNSQIDNLLKNRVIEKWIDVVILVSSNVEFDRPEISRIIELYKEQLESESSYLNNNEFLEIAHFIVRWKSDDRNKWNEDIRQIISFTKIMIDKSDSSDKSRYAEWINSFKNIMAYNHIFRNAEVNFWKEGISRKNVARAISWYDGEYDKNLDKKASDAISAEFEKNKKDASYICNIIDIKKVGPKLREKIGEIVYESIKNLGNGDYLYGKKQIASIINYVPKEIAKRIKDKLKENKVELFE